DWEQHKLKDVVDLLKDGTHGTHKNGKEAFLLSAKNIKNGQLIIDELTDRKISGDDYNLIFQNYTLVDQDLLVTIVGTIGQTALYKESDIKLAFQRSVAIIRGNKNMNQNFLKSTVDSNYIQKQLKQAASMSAQAGVYLGDLEKLIIYIPKLLEQIKIGNFFKQLDETIANHQRKLEKLQALKKAYLHEMFVKEGVRQMSNAPKNATEKTIQEKLVKRMQKYKWEAPDFLNGNKQKVGVPDLVNHWRSELNRINVDQLEGVALTDNEFSQVMAKVSQIANSFEASKLLAMEGSTGKIDGIYRDAHPDVTREQITLTIFKKAEVRGGDSSYRIAREVETASGN